MPDTAGKEYMPDGNKDEHSITAQAKAVIRPPAAIFCVLFMPVNLCSSCKDSPSKAYMHIYHSIRTVSEMLLYYIRPVHLNAAGVCG